VPFIYDWIETRIDSNDKGPGGTEAFSLAG